MNYFVYILLSANDNKCYVGMTKDIQHRLNEHNSGRVNSTKARIPFRVVYSEECANRQDARRREKYWKSGAGREKIRTIMADLPLGKS